MTQSPAEEWSKRAQAEYASAALASDLLHRLFVLGASPDVLLDAQKIIGDEIEHAILCHEIATRLGARPQTVDDRTLAIPGDTSLETTLGFTIEFFCCGESVARVLFQEMAAVARDDGARSVLERIHKDEARHGAFGFFVLDDLLPRADKETVIRLRASTSAAVTRVRGRYVSRHPANASPANTPSDDALGLGILPARRMAELVSEELERRVLPELKRRGLIDVESAHRGLSDSS